jgi:hypothetical protein
MGTLCSASSSRSPPGRPPGGSSAIATMGKTPIAPMNAASTELSFSLSLLLSSLQPCPPPVRPREAAPTWKRGTMTTMKPCRHQTPRVIVRGCRHAVATGGMADNVSHPSQPPTVLEWGRRNDDRRSWGRKIIRWEIFCRLTISYCSTSV